MHKELKKQEEVIAIVVILYLKETARSLQKNRREETMKIMINVVATKDAVNDLRNLL